ncbi:MAG: hypothetical protein HYT71_03570 [Candidatus Aenigmarchaeota archaeon]|nr:hypothetical protein [Candidatus Aenigmarchaeota archaeon]
MSYKQIFDYYSRDDVQQALLEVSVDKEIAGIFKTGSFGQRPNVLVYPTDIVNMVKSGTVSFHGSVERWDNAMSLRSGMLKEDLDSLRKGFELIIDIDIKDFEFAKVCTKIFFDELSRHGIKNIGVKYTGGKSFHIGVPFEAFPASIDYVPTKSQYPAVPQVIISYLKHKTVPKIRDAILSLEPDIEKIANRLNLQATALIGTDGLDVDKIIGSSRKMLSQDMGIKSVDKAVTGFVGGAITEFGLFTSRHMFRLPYSLHESSLLVSLPMKISDIDKFDKADAAPENVEVKEKFLDRSVRDSAGMESLITEAMDWNSSRMKQEEVKKKFIITNSDKITESFFPPSIKKIMGGMADGRKRSVLILFNFLRNMNWEDDEIENFIGSWNEKNTPPLPLNYIRSQIRWLRASRKMLPPNFENENFYKPMGINCDVEINAGSRNPVTYAIREFRSSSRKMYKKPVKKQSKKENDEYVDG